MRGSARDEPDVASLRGAKSTCCFARSRLPGPAHSSPSAPSRRNHQTPQTDRARVPRRIGQGRAGEAATIGYASKYLDGPERDAQFKSLTVTELKCRRHSCLLYRRFSTCRPLELSPAWTDRSRRHSRRECLRHTITPLTYASAP